jgi:hypothetical protein
MESNIYNMLRITVQSTGSAGITFQSFENSDLTKPVNGIDEEAGNLILIFEDEEEALNYSYNLEDISEDISDNDSPVKTMLNDIIVAIQNDEFVKSYNSQ